MIIINKKKDSCSSIICKFFIIFYLVNFGNLEWFYSSFKFYFDKLVIDFWFLIFVGDMVSGILFSYMMFSNYDMDIYGEVSDRMIYIE